MRLIRPERCSAMCHINRVYDVINLIIHWGETGLANASVSLSKIDAPKVGKSVFCSFEVFYHNVRASHSPTVFI